MNKQEVIDYLANAHEISKAQAGRVLGTLLDVVVTKVKKGEPVVIPGFGTFKPFKRKARIGRNPSTGATIKISAATLPKFVAGAAFKRAVDSKAFGGATASKSKGTAAAAKKAAAAKRAAKA